MDLCGGLYWPFLPVDVYASSGAVTDNVNVSSQHRGQGPFQPIAQRTTKEPNDAMTTSSYTLCLYSRHFWLTETMQAFGMIGARTADRLFRQPGAKIMSKVSNMMVLLIEPDPFLPLSVTVTIFQGHNGVQQFQLKCYTPFWSGWKFVWSTKSLKKMFNFYTYIISPLFKGYLSDLTQIITLVYFTI